MFFFLGFDVCFDGATHSLTKIILHSNLPGHDTFCQYTRCFFKLVLPFGIIDVSSPWSYVAHHFPASTKPLTLNSRRVVGGPPSFYHSYKGTFIFHQFQVDVARILLQRFHCSATSKQISNLIVRLPPPANKMTESGFWLLEVTKKRFEVEIQFRHQYFMLKFSKVSFFSFS